MKVEQTVGMSFEVVLSMSVRSLLKLTLIVQILFIWMPTFGKECEALLGSQGRSYGSNHYSTFQISEFELAMEIGLHGRFDTFPGNGRGYSVLMHSDRMYIIDREGATAVLVEFPGDDVRDYRASRIYSPYSVEKLNQILSAVGSTELWLLFSFIEQHALSSSGKIGWIDIPQEVSFEVTGRSLIGDRNRAADFGQLERDRIELAKKIQFSQLPFQATAPTGNQSLMVGQAEYGVLIPDDGSVDIIGTYGVGPCVGIVLVNQRTGASVVAHFDGMTDVDSQMKIVLSQVNGSLDQLGAWIITSQLDAPLMLKIVNSLDNNRVPILGASDKTSEISIDMASFSGSTNSIS